MLAGAGDPVALALGLAALGFGGRALALGRRGPALALLALALLAAASALRAENRAAAEPSLLFLDVGHGDAILLRAGRHAWLVDAGTRFAGFDAGRSVVLPALRAEGVRRLDALVLTHADLDHVGGAAAVLEALPVAELWLTAQTLAAPVLRRLRGLAARRGVAVRIVAAGRLRAPAGVSLHALWPPAELAPSGTNAGSLVLRVEAAGICALLMGDAPAAVERELALQPKRCEVLKLGHHGSATSSDPRFLDAFTPEIAIASAGRRPRSPLPNSRVRERLAARSISLWKTRSDGAISVRLGRPGPQVDPFLTRPFRED